jgi:glycosyltransferase involved in cell wall biosynthesis
VVARRRRARLVYDAHELYAEFEADPPRVQRAIASLLEGVLARRADAVVTVSAALADELHRRLALAARPLVVLNVPELDDREPAPRADGPLRVVYIGALGSGRPLGDLLLALEGAEGIRLTLHVVQLAPEMLRSDVLRSGHGERVDVAGPVAPHDLIETLHAHDVGVVFDQPVTRNAELSLPNKLFEYFMAGLAVVAPRLPGLAPVVEETGAGLLFEPGRPDELGRALASLAADHGRLTELRRNAREAARTRFNATAQEPILAHAWGRSGDDEHAPRVDPTR